MAFTSGPADPITGFYDAGDLRVASPARRLSAALIDHVLVMVPFVMTVTIGSIVSLRRHASHTYTSAESG